MPEKIAIATMDFGGTTADIALIADYKVVSPKSIVHFDVDPNNLNSILENIKNGFRDVIEAGRHEGYDVRALSFAFPGPADYKKGVIGWLNNVPAFQKEKGVSLGYLLNLHFNLPVFINNDGDLFAEGQRVHGRVAELNKDPRKEWNLTGCAGLTIGSGLGCGKSTDRYGMELGESGTGLEFGINPIAFDGKEVRLEYIVSRRGLVRLYNQEVQKEEDKLGIDDPNAPLKIAEFTRNNNTSTDKKLSATLAYGKFGGYVGLALTWASNIFDCPVIVLGGGVSNSYNLFIVSAMRKLRGEVRDEQGVKSLMKTPYNLEDPRELESFLKSGDVFGNKKVGTCKSNLSTAEAIYAGAYGFALRELGLKS